MYEYTLGAKLVVEYTPRPFICHGIQDFLSRLSLTEPTETSNDAFSVLLYSYSPYRLPVYYLPLLYLLTNHFAFNRADY